ncbi:MAG: DUF4433 domain-containing protein [Chloroflexi bacterium]|nr:DUF4433 domain-containing protein [Chloroflexota bacterium]
MKRRSIQGLYYITHVENIPSILKSGIFSHERIETEKIPFVRIYDENIVSNRHSITVPDGRNLWHFANVYFQPRNPMLYRVVHEKSEDIIAVLGLRSEILEKHDIYITTGNAAHSLTNILYPIEAIKELPTIIKNSVKLDWWHEEDGSKRKIMAECLIPDMITPDMIHTIYVAKSKTRATIKELINRDDIPVVLEPNMFFLPIKQYQITPRLALAEGDLFFSRMQTLTVSVNTVGIMGKGLASRAKYQFPGVYVYYQDLCRNKKLVMGKPRLYKRETSLEHELADEPDTLSNLHAGKWFLLFPTKHHWRQDADIKGIEEGMSWLAQNYKKEGIKSLALPALGCGLGNLEWRKVGPLMCKYVKDLDIQAVIYLPSEKEVNPEQLTKEFLLG